MFLGLKKFWKGRGEELLIAEQCNFEVDSPK